MKNFIIFFILLNLNKCDKSIINQNQNNISNSFNNKNLIITILTRFKWKKILPFLKSLIKTNLQNCDVIIFVKEVKISIIKNLKSFGINIHEISDKFENIPIYNYRWKVYNEFLKKNRKKYNFVLSVDLKDTIIQNDIFEVYKDYKHLLGFSLEDAPLWYGFHGPRILEIFGQKLYQKLKDEKIINAGTVWGTEDEFFKFSQILWKNLLIYPQAEDQTMLNYLYYHKQFFKNVTIFSDNCGPVITIGLTKRNYINLDSENNILNSGNQIASIIHQYDRHKDIQVKIKEKYCPEFIYEQNHFINTIYFFIILEIVTILFSIKIIKFFYLKGKNNFFQQKK